MYSKRFNRRRFLQLMAGSAAGAMIAGCSSSDEPEATAKPVELEFWDWDHTPRVEFTNKLIEEFHNEHPEITLKYNPLGWTDIETKLLTVATAGTGPQFSNVHYFWRYDLQRAGVLAPYPDDMFDWDKLVSTPFNRDPDTGHIYTCDFCYYCDMVMYNTELLAAEGIKPEDIPGNWDDYMAMAQQLTKTDANGNITQAGLSLNDYWAREWLWHTLVYQQGGWLYNENGTAALWESEESVRALQHIKDIYHKYKVDGAEFLGSYDAFGNASAATYIDQGYMIAPIANDFPDLEGKWGTTTTPTFTGTQEPAWGMALPEEGFCVFNNFSAEEQEAAFAYIDFMLGSDERRLDWAIIMDGPPDRKDLLDHSRLKEEAKVDGIFSQAKTMPWRVVYGERPLEAEKLWRTMFDEVILENEDPKVALGKATEQMNAAFDESGEKRFIVERNYTPG